MCFVPLCPICANNDKTIDNILILCPWASWVWYGGPLCLQINQNTITTLVDWFCSVANLAQGKNEDMDRILSQLVFLCWFIWRARCDAIFNLIHPSLYRTIRAIATALDSYESTFTPLRMSGLARTSSSPGFPRSTLWSPLIG